MKINMITARMILVAALLSSFCLRVSAEDKEPFGTGGFVVLENADGSWAAGAPSCLGSDFEGNVKSASLKGGDKDKLLIRMDGITVPWTFDTEEKDIPLKPIIDGGSIEMEVHGYGSLASEANLDLYNDQSGLSAIKASHLSGAVTDSLPENVDCRIVGVSIATANGKFVSDDTDHPLKDIIKADLLYAAIEYIPESKTRGNIGTVDEMKSLGVKSVVFLGLNCALDDEKSKVVEARWVGNAPAEFCEAKTSPIGDLGSEVGLDVDIITSSLKTPASGSLQKITIPASTINNIIDLGLTDDLVAVRVGAPGGNLLVADLPAFSVPVPGLPEDLRFAKSRITFTIGSSHNGTSFGFSIDAGLENPGVLLGPLGENISGTKRVSLTVSGKTLVVNFRNSLEDIKPLGFSLLEPTIAVDLERRGVLLSGSLQLPDTLPLPVGNTVDVTCELSQSSLQFMVISDIEVPIFNDKIRIGLNTLVLGASDNEVYFMAVGKAKFVEDISMLQGIDAFKRLGLDLTVGAELTAKVFVQTDGTFHVELVTEDLLTLEAGPVKSNLDEVSFVLDHTPGSDWVASVAGQTSLDISAGIFNFHATTRAELSTDGTLKVEIPDDPENPTRVEIGELAIILKHGEFLIAKDADGQYQVSIDATAAMNLPEEIPMIGGQELEGRMAAKSDGTFLFEVTKIPQLEFLDMRVGLKTLKIENKKENNTFLLSFEAGAGVEFLPTFALPALRNETVEGSVLVQSDLTVKFTLSGVVMNIGDFRFGVEELSVGVIKGRDIAVSGTGVLEVEYPSSKYFGIGLPAALAGKETGPSFDLRGTISVSTTNVYFQAQSDSMEIPIDIPSVIEGVTIKVEQIGAGITYNGCPLFDLKGALYLPDLEGNGETGVTSALGRPYDSMLGLKLAGNVQDGIALAVETEGSPKIAIRPVFEFTLDEVGVSTWLYGYALSADLSTRLKIGQPENGFGTLFDLKEGHLTFIQLMPSPLLVPVPFYDSCRIEANVGGFGMALESEFPRPNMIDFGTIIDVVGYIQKGDVEGIFLECGTGGKFNALFPRFAVNEASLMMPEAVSKTLNAPANLDLLKSVGGKIDLNSGDIVPQMIPLVRAVQNPKDTLAGLVSMIPEERREGRFAARIGIGNVNLLKGRFHYRLQAREQVFVNRTVPNLKHILTAVDVLNKAEAQPGQYSTQHWKLIKTDSGFFGLQNRSSKRYLALGARSGNDNGANVILGRFSEDNKNCLWAKSKAGDGKYRFSNLSNRLNLSADDDNVCLWDSSAGKKNRWKILPVFGTPYVRLLNEETGKVVDTSGSSRVGTNVTLSDYPEAETLVAGSTSVITKASKIQVAEEVDAAKDFVDGLAMSAGAEPSQLMQKVRSLASGKSMSGNDSIGLDVALTSNTVVSVSPYGHTKSNIGLGALELRRMVENPPLAGVTGTLKTLKLDVVAGTGIYPVRGIATPRDVTMGNPDCYAARTWKLLWKKRKKKFKTKVNGTKIKIRLKNGTYVYLDVDVYCRIAMTVNKAKYVKIGGVKVFAGYYDVAVRKWKKANSIRVDSSGNIYAKYVCSSYETPELALFKPGETDKLGDPGIIDYTKSLSKTGLVATGAFENTKYDPEMVFSFSDSQGWKAVLTGIDSLAITSPKKETQTVSLASGINSVLDQMMTGSSSSREYGEDGKMFWYFAQPGGATLTGTAEKSDEIVAETGSEIMYRTNIWPQNGTVLTATVTDSGALSGIYGLKPSGSSVSSAVVSSGGVSHEIMVARAEVEKELTKDNIAESASSILPSDTPYGPYITSVFLNSGGMKHSVKIVNKNRGVVRDPAFREIPMGLDLDGSMQIGDKKLIETALAFAGHIDEAGGVALAANGNIVVQGFELGSSSFSFKHYPNGRDNGLTFSGNLQAPFQGSLSGEIHENGNFHVSGSVRLLVPNMATTGFIGDIVMDPDESWLHGGVYVGGTRILYTHTKITRNNSHITIDNSNGFNIGVGGYYKDYWFFGWRKRWVAYSGAKGRLTTNIDYKYKKPASITADITVYLQGWILDRSLGRFDRTWHVPNLCAVNRRKVLGRNLDWRAIPLYLKWDAPWPLWDPQIGSR